MSTTHIKQLSVLFFVFVAIGCKSDDLRVNDVTGLNPVVVSEIRSPITEQEIIQAVKDANSLGLKISIGGQRHSQGSQTTFTDALFLDMRKFNRVIDINEKDKTIIVQSGATWEMVQNAISPLGLSVAVQQASNIFTVGGSLSVNIHGWDPRYLEFVSTVKKFHLILANGERLEVSREKNRELFRWAIGGYGLFGIITDVTLQLTDNHLLKKETIEMSLADYPAYYETEILNHSNVELHYARPSIQGKDFFENLLVTKYTTAKDELLKEEHLEDEKNIFRNFWVFQISRYFRIPGLFDAGKPFRWWLQKKIIDVPGKVIEISRNRAMRPEIQFTLIPSGFFHTDILQEYFVPKEKLVDFIRELKVNFTKHNVNLLSSTIRPVHPDTETGLPYARFEGYAIVLYINLLTTPGKFFSKRWGEEKAKVWTNEMIDIVKKYNGTYYLPYQLYPTRDQLQSIYPQFNELVKMKQKYDPKNIFWNKFYEKYR